LRRKFDYGSPNQRANIYIDGQFAGTWYTAGYFNGADADGHVRRWREEEFPLPISLTANKSSVVVRVEFVPTSDPPNQNWTEFRYQMYSFVMPQGEVPGTATPTDTPSATTTRVAGNTRTPTAAATGIATTTPCPMSFTDVSP